LDRLDLLADTAPGPERTIAANQELDRVLGRLSSVSERMCRIYVAHLIGYSYQEIGTALGIMPRTVERHVASASVALKEIAPEKLIGP